MLLSRDPGLDLSRDNDPSDLENTLAERVPPWSKSLAVHLDYSTEAGVRAIKCTEVSRAVDLQNI